METAEVPNRSTNVYKAIDPRLDVGRLLLEDLDPFEVTTKGVTEELLQNVARDNTQYIVNELWKLPTERVEDAIVAVLPTPVTRIPREKPIPIERPPSKWESYRLLKGIPKHKRSRKVWDKTTEDWKPRWGYQRANDKTKEWMAVVPEKSDPNRDIYEERIQAKKERVAKNELQRMRNLSRGQRPDLIPGIGFTAKAKTNKELGYQINRARGATASMGKFDENLRNEKAPKDKRKKRQFAPNEVSSKSEKDHQMDLLKKLNAKKPRVNAEKAANYELQKTEASNRKAKLSTAAARGRGRKTGGRGKR